MWAYVPSPPSNASGSSCIRHAHSSSVIAEFILLWPRMRSASDFHADAVARRKSALLRATLVMPHRRRGAAAAIMQIRPSLPVFSIQHVADLCWPIDRPRRRPCVQPSVRSAFARHGEQPLRRFARALFAHCPFTTNHTTWLLYTFNVALFAAAIVHLLLSLSLSFFPFIYLPSRTTRPISSPHDVGR
jgi:hypothetical protein